MTVLPPAFYWMGFVRCLYNFNYNKNFPKRIYSGKYSADVIHSFFNSKINTHGGTAQVIGSRGEGGNQGEGNQNPKVN